VNEIISSAIWSPVRLLDKNEFASGGVNGNMNEHAIALANRTHFLKEIIDELKNEVARLNEHAENCNCSGEPEPGAISVGISPDLQYMDDWTERKIRWAIEVNDTLYSREIGDGGEYLYLEDYLQRNKEMLGITGEYKEEESAVYINNITNTQKFVRLIPNVPYTSNMKIIGNSTAVIDSEGVISFWLKANNEVQIPDDGGSNGGGTVHYDLDNIIYVHNSPHIIYGVIRKYIGINSQELFLVRFDLKEEVDTSTLECRYFLPLKASSQIDNFFATDTPNGVILNTWSDGVNVDLIRDTGTSIGYEDILPISQAYSLHNYIPLPFSNKFISPLSNGNPSGFYFCTLENGQMSGSFAFSNSFYGNVYNRSLTKLLIRDAPAYLHNQSIYTITESEIEKTASIPMKDVYDSITDYWGPVASTSTNRYGVILNRSNSTSQKVLQIVDFETLEMKFIDVTEYTENSIQYIHASDDLSKIAFGRYKRSNFIEIEYDYASNSILSSKSNTQSFYMSNDAKFKIEPIIQESKPYLKLSNDISESAIYSLEDLLTIY